MRESVPTASWAPAAPALLPHPVHPRVRGHAHLLPLFAVLVLLAAPPPGGAAADGGGTGTLADAASGVLVLWAFATALRSGVRPLTPRAAGLFALAAGGLAVAAAGAGDPSQALPGLARYLQIFVLVPLAVLLLVRDRRDFTAVLGALVALALVEGGVGVHQYLTATGASYMGEDIRAVGTFGASDIMGMATVVAHGLVAAVALALAPGARARRGQRAAALACAALLLVPLALSFSRGAWIATALTCTALLFLAGVRRALRVLAALLALTVVLVGGAGAGTAMLQERLSSITKVTDAPDQSVTDRYTLWSAAAGMWRESPVTGVGLKGFPAHRDSHAPLALSSGSDTAGAGAAFRRQPLLSPHNMYLLVLSEQGLVGVCTLVGGWAALLALALRRLHRERARPDADAAAAAAAAADTAAGAGAGAGAGANAVSHTDCGLAATGLLLWLLVDFFYGDIGGPSTILTALALGLAARWALGRADTAGTDAAGATGEPDAGDGRGGPGGPDDPGGPDGPARVQLPPGSPRVREAARR
ncbi:O-antigen ligase family protein [Streptomyces sp. NPDC059070]|uniref:O-antigen ligase family protein n=1 Tax=Streptomyces sp. NPDC059070 TaxID=3346713 RepID=UPI0036A4B603